MKKSKEETAKTRKRIVQVAAQELRRNGIHKTGVAEVMAAAGLTQGGFYRHFDSKDQLVAEACTASMEPLLSSYKEAVEGGENAILKQLDKYLLNHGCDDFLEGCPLVYLGSELARADINARKATSEGYRAIIEVITNSKRYKNSPAARAQAIFMLSAMIGAITISRIADDPKLSAQVLTETRNHLAAQMEKASFPKRLKTARSSSKAKRRAG